MYKFISIITFIMLGFSLSIQAQTISNGGTIIIRQKDIPTNNGGRPHTPARIPLLCELEGNKIVITADYPVMLIAEVSANDNTEVVAEYFSEEPKTFHQFYVEPQNTTLTIEIQVGDKSYIGEFFY